MKDLMGRTKTRLELIREALHHFKGPSPLKVIITGLPRSGTSFLSGLIVRMGYSPGPQNWLKEANYLNPYGFYESLPLLNIESKVLRARGGDFNQLPSFPPNWVSDHTYHIKLLKRYVRHGGIEVYKGNRIVVLADLYQTAFPNAQFIFVTRDEQATFESELRHGPKDWDAWRTLQTQRLELWSKSKVSRSSLNIRFEDFHSDIEETIHTIAQFLNKKLSEEALTTCITFYKSKSVRQNVKESR